MTKDPCAECGHYVTVIARATVATGTVVLRLCDRCAAPLEGRLDVTLTPAHPAGRLVVGPVTGTY